MHLKINRAVARLSCTGFPDRKVSLNGLFNWVVGLVLDLQCFDQTAANGWAGAMPLDRILTETDGPFASSRTGPLMPWDVREAEEGLAALWRCELRVSEKYPC